MNQGNIFRFLTKPCSPDNLLEAVQAGIHEYRRTHKERKFNKRSRTWLTKAMEVQQNLMPNAGVVWDGLDVAGRSLFCDQTGGDYYDYFEKSDSARRTISIVAGDVSDHGLPSALLMTTARAFEECATRPGSVSTIVGHVNRHLTHDVQASGRFMTLFYAGSTARIGASTGSAPATIRPSCMTRAPASSASWQGRAACRSVCSERLATRNTAASLRPARCSSSGRTVSGRRVTERAECSANCWSSR